MPFKTNYTRFSAILDEEYIMSLHPKTFKKVLDCITINDDVKIVEKYYDQLDAEQLKISLFHTIPNNSHLCANFLLQKNAPRMYSIYPYFQQYMGVMKYDLLEVFNLYYFNRLSNVNIRSLLEVARTCDNPIAYKYFQDKLNHKIESFEYHNSLLYARLKMIEYFEGIVPLEHIVKNFFYPNIKNKHYVEHKQELTNQLQRRKLYECVGGIDHKENTKKRI